MKSQVKIGGLLALDPNRYRKLFLSLFLAEMLFFGSFVLYIGLGFEYLLLINLGVIFLVIINPLWLTAPHRIVFLSLFLSVLPNYRLIQIRLLDWTLLSLAISVGLISLIYGKIRLNIKKIDLYIILYLGTIVISGVVSGHLINTHIKAVLYGFLIFWATRSYLYNERKWKMVLPLLPICGLLIVLQMTLSFMQYHPQLLTFSFSRSEANVSWGNTNYLAAILVLLLPTVLSLFLATKKILWKLSALGLATSMIISVFWTISRTGALCLLLILTMFLFSLDKRKVLLVLLGAFIAYCVLSPFVSKVTKRFSSSDIGSYFSALERYDMWKNSWNIFKNNPVIGVGMGNAEVVTIFKSRSTNPHNVIFKSLSETGIVGFFLLLLIFKELFNALFKLKKLIKNTSGDRIIYLGFLITLSVSILNRMLEVIGDRYEVIFWFIMALLFLAVERKAADSSHLLLEPRK